MIKNIGPILAKRRAEKGISQKELAALLNVHGFGVTNQAVSKWENGVTQPSAVQFIALCQILDIRDVVGEFCGSADGGVFYGLNSRGKEMASEYISLLKLSDKYRDEMADVIHIRKLPLYNIAASAGTGQFLDSDGYETVDVGGDVPESADFGVRLSGDSMEPRYQDGDIAWVSQDRNIRNGEVGIFLFDGNVYCKKLDRHENVLRLMSFNSKYAPIEIDGEKEFRPFGKVVGKWSTGR